MNQLDENLDLPDFMVKSTLGVTLTTTVVLTPFVINNFIQGRVLLGMLTFAILVLCAVNAWFGFRGKYHAELNLFAVAPVLTVAIVLAVHGLGVVGSYWAPMGVLAFYFILPEKRAWIANIIFIALISPVAWKVLPPEIAMRFFAVLLGVSLRRRFLRWRGLMSKLMAYLVSNILLQ